MWAQRKGAEASHAMEGWNLIPVIVFSRALPAGSTVTRQNIAERSVPSQFVTSSVVKPGSARDVIGHALLSDVQPGDLVLWSQFPGRKTCERIAAVCQSVADDPVKSASAPAVPNPSPEPSNKQ